MTLTKEEQELVDAIDATFGAGISRVMMSRDERRIANRLAKAGILHKGHHAIGNSLTRGRVAFFIA